MNKVKETEVILTQKQVNELKGFAVYVSVQPPSLMIRIPFVKTADITKLNIYNTLLGECKG